MPLKQLDHVNVRTDNLDTMMTWYTNILGMHSGDRPNLPTSGAWMYVGDQAVVHLIAANGTAGVGSEVDLKLEHFALSATGMKEFELNLAAAGEKFVRRDVPGGIITQFNVWDPDGNHIHIDFPTSEDM